VDATAGRIQAILAAERALNADRRITV